MKIVVVGLGYVGLSNAILLAKHNEVIGVDISQQRVEAINKKRSYINESDLSQYLKNNTINLTASLDLVGSLENADYVLVATPTSYQEATGSFDTSTLEAVSAQVVKHAPNALVVIKSTIPIGFTKHLCSKLNTDNIIFSPEFLREGCSLHDNLYPSRIVVGEQSTRAAEFAKIMEKGCLKDDVEILLTESQEAEAIKLFANTYLATRIAFFNELDTFASENHLDTKQIISGVCADPRIGNFYNNPSFGYGGYCLPKDSKQLLTNFNGIPQKLISACIESNEVRKNYIVNKILEMEPNVVGIYRLVMKKDSDNWRDSASYHILQVLIKHQIKVIIYEPLLNQKTFENCEVINDISRFDQYSDLIIANRLDAEIIERGDAVFSRDIYNHG